MSETNEPLCSSLWSYGPTAAKQLANHNVVEIADAPGIKIICLKVRGYMSPKSGRKSVS